MEGDELPYLPQHQIVVSAAAKLPRWEIGATTRYQGEARDVAGQGEIAERERLAAAQLKADAIDGLEHAAAVVEIRAQISNS
jgi:hypothetical protein